MSKVPTPVNEPVLSYAPGTPERAELKRELERQRANAPEIGLWIGSEPGARSETRSFTCPHDHELVLGRHALASRADVLRAIEAAEAARPAWAGMDQSQRDAVFLRAAALLAGPWRQRLNVATMLNQSKTPHQAEIDSACELIDFFRFNVHFTERIAGEQPLSDAAAWNRLELRPLDGFVYAVTPFNFTSIAGNLPTAPALLGNSVVWKPSPSAVLSAHWLVELLREAGLPDGVINVVYGDAEEITSAVLGHPGFAGLHFTGSTAVLRQLFREIGKNLENYRSYPRVVGESGGKDFIIAHPSADVEALAVAIVRGGYEFQGQKCSAASRLYIPRSLQKPLWERVTGMISELVVGDPTDFKSFLGAVINRQAYDKITGYQKLAREDPACRVLAGGGASDDRGFFVEPTLVETDDPKHRLLAEEIFGPVVTAYAYDDARFDDTLKLVDQTSPYALTGAVFSRDRAAVQRASLALRHAAGNFYVNDKPTGAVVGQQPFGGGRMSGTNDKAGSLFNLLRWISPRAVKETFAAPLDWRYPFLRDE